MARFFSCCADLLVEPLEERHKCLECRSVLRDAVQTEEGDRLCRSCYIHLFINGSSSKDNLVHGSTIDVVRYRSKTCHPDRAIRNEVNQLLVRCVFHNRGCSWQGELQHHEEHCCGCPYKFSSEEYCQVRGDQFQMPSASPPPPCITDAPMLLALMFLTYLQQRAIQQFLKPAYFVEMGMEILGRALNPVVAHLHHAHWAKEVKFKIRTVVYKSDDDNTTVMDWKPVPDPTIPMRCPEAFSGDSVLEHMKQPENIKHYAKLIQYTAPKDLDDDIKGILQNHPKVCPLPLNPEKALDVLAKMFSFLERVEAGLRRNNEDAIAECITPLTNNLQKLFRVAQTFLKHPLPLPV